MNESSRSGRHESGDLKGSRKLSLVDLVQALQSKIAEKTKLIDSKSRALIEKQRFVENVIASMGDSVVIFDADGLIQSVNPATIDLLGYEGKELIGRPASLLWARPEQAKLFRGEEFAKLLDGQGLSMSDLFYRGRRGEEIPVNWRGSPITDDDGLVKGFVGIARDARLELKVQSEKLKAIRTMAASVAHEIRNPLNAIQNSVGLLRRDLDLSGDDEELLEIVHEETLRISNIVQQFLKFARPAPAMMELGDIGSLIRDTMTLLNNDERVTEHHSFDLELPDDLPMARHDKDKVKQIMWNLLTNALDALPKGGHIGVKARALDDSGVEISVRDNGPGIPAAILPKIFEPFMTSKSRGSGLGLAIVKAIMDSHGGDLRIKTSQGQGTTFLLRFPGQVNADPEGV
ncbi:MAG: ATP-binding protein [Planctomycetota bacterium]|nr:ATP-binding protein [Planctomycetota bacterium]